MVRVMKSPNMISTTGRSPVIAAPTATPVKPASEIGVSTTRAAPNSSTSPDKTLNGVPASATSSPKIHTLASRRISSASASRTACANVSSRSGIHILIDLFHAGIRRGDGELYRRFHLRAHFRRNFFQRGSVGITLSQQPVRVQRDRIALALPPLLFLFRAVILAIDVAHMMTAVTIGIALQKRRPPTGTRTLHQPRRDFKYRARVLSLATLAFNAERGGAAENGSRRGFRVMRVLVVEIVFADVNHRQLPQLRQVHHFVKRSLAQRTFAEKTYGHTIGSQMLRRECRAGGDSHAAAYDRIRAQVAGCRIGNVHRSAFTAAITGFLTQQLGEHSIGRRALGQAMSVAAVCAGDVIIDAQRFADAHRHGFFAAVKVRQTGHESPRVKFVHLLFKQANAYQFAVDAKPLVPFRLSGRLVARSRLGGRSRHFFFAPAVTGVDTPDIVA